MPIYGSTTDGGELVELDSPIRYTTALPASGDFPGQLWCDKSVSPPDWYQWDGTAFVEFILTPELTATLALYLLLADVTATPGTADKVPRADANGRLAVDWLARAADAGIIRTARIGGAPSYHTIGANEVVARGSAITELQGLPIPAQSILMRAAADLVASTCAANQWLGRTATGDLGFKSSSSLWSNLLNQGPVVGTAFPTTSLVDGRPFVRTDHGHTAYVYSSAAGGWLSIAEHEIPFFVSVDVSVAMYLGAGYGGTTGFSDNYGPTFGYQTRVSGISLAMAASGTATVEVTAGGVAIAGAELALVAAQRGSSEALAPSTANVASASVYGVKLKSGTLEGPAFGTVRVRRFET